jgi:hypothetical protein
MTHPAPAAGAGVDVAQKLAAQLGIAALHRLGKQGQLELLQFRVSQLRQKGQTFHIVFLERRSGAVIWVSAKLCRSSATSASICLVHSARSIMDFDTAQKSLCDQRRLPCHTMRKCCLGL